MSENCWRSGKQGRSCSDATELGIFSGSTLFAQDCPSEHIGKKRQVGKILPSPNADTCTNVFKGNYGMVLWRMVSLDTSVQIILKCLGGEWLALPTSYREVPGSIPTGGGILLLSARYFIPYHTSIVSVHK